jgi:methyl-accepting chemotaxis protein
LSDGDIVKGTAVYERIDKYLITQFETGKLKILMDNLIELTGFTKEALKSSDNNELLSGIKKSSGDVSTILDNLREIIEDPQVKRDIKSTIKYSSLSIKDLSEIVESNKNEIKQIFAKAPESIDKTINNLESLNKNMPRVNENIQEASTTINRATSSLSVTNCNLDTINKKVPEIPPCLLNKADNALTKFDCIGTELIDLLNKKFLVFRFMFGKPGSSFERCKDPNCIESR